MVKKETQKGRHEMDKALKKKIATFVDKYFATHDMYVRSAKDTEREAKQQEEEKQAARAEKEGSNGAGNQKRDEERKPQQGSELTN